MGLKEMFAAFMVSEEPKRDRGSVSFKPGTRPAIILQTLCEGHALSGWDACKLLKTHNGDRELRRVRRKLLAAGIRLVNFAVTAKNGRDYKSTLIAFDQREEAARLLKVS